jgi:hypothetical protein
MLEFRARRNRTGEGGAYIRDVTEEYIRGGDLSTSLRTFFFSTVKTERTPFIG